MKRTKLIDRLLPDYTTGEEIFNMLTHVVGGAFGVVYMTVCIIISIYHRNVWGVVSSTIYGASVISLFTMSSVYHGVKPGMAKKVLQVLDHCTIYFMIAGTYTPITLSLMRKTNPIIAWVVFGIVWGIAALAITLTAIDLKKYNIFSMICYIGMGWCIIGSIKQAYIALTHPGFMWLLLGGIMYTIGAVLYGIGAKKRYIHSVFHIFVVIASIMHFVCIAFFVV